MMSREEFQAAAKALGRAAVESGDFYDVVDNFMLGYVEAQQEFFTEDSPHKFKIGCLTELKSVSENLLRDAVDDARADYYSWEKIARSLDVSKQTAWKKYRKDGEADPM